VRGLSTQPDELYCQTLEDGETVQCTYRDDTADDVVTDVSPQQGNGDARDARDEPKQRTERTTINQQTQPELSNNNQDIHVGSITYHHPFNNYPTPVQNILRQYNLQQDDANWYYELGLAHARDQDGTADKNTGPQYAMNAYQQAIQLYQGVRQSSSTTPVQYNHAGHYLANLYVDMSAAYGNDDKVNSLLYIQQAEDLYRSLRASTTLIASELKLVDLGWAHACVRLGVLLIEHELESISAKAVEENATQHSSRKGHDFFQQAIQVYSTILENEQNPTEVIIVKRDLANALQNSATAAAALGMNSIEHYTQALDLYKSIFHHLTTPREQENVAISMGDLLFSLSYSYLQAGQFDKSVEHYRATMDWYEEHDISPPRSEPMGSFGEDTIDLYQNALVRLRRLL
jgi:tetratricopeptide (TPR) repeat protein